MKNNVFMTYFSGPRNQSIEETIFDKKSISDKPREISFVKEESLFQNFRQDVLETELFSETLILEEKRKLKRAAKIMRLMLNLREC